MFGFGRKTPAPRVVELRTPFPGDVVPVTEVPDPVFSGKMVGDGVAVIPRDDASSVTVCAPAAGELVTMFATGHAFAVVTAEGLEVLVHIGLDTVELKGEGFTPLVARGESVVAGQPIVEVDLDIVRGHGKNPVTPVVMSNRKQVAAVDVTTGPAADGAVIAGVTLV